MAKSRKATRDAGTGRFVPKREATRRPATTVTETINPTNGPTKSVTRDAKSGQFVPKSEASRRPKTTVTDTVPV